MPKGKGADEHQEGQALRRFAQRTKVVWSKHLSPFFKPLRCFPEVFGNATLSCGHLSPFISREMPFFFGKTGLSLSGGRTLCWKRGNGGEVIAPPSSSDRKDTLYDSPVVFGKLRTRHS